MCEVQLREKVIVVVSVVSCDLVEFENNCPSSEVHLSVPSMEGHDACKACLSV
jgi:hypothetical protein